MRRLLADRAGAHVPPESNLEARFQAIAKKAGVNSLVRQRDVGGADWVGRVDYLDPDRKLIVEIDSDVHHTSLLDATADALRDGPWSRRATRLFVSTNTTCGIARRRWWRNFE